MGSSLKVATIYGIEVRIHFSFLLLLAFFGFQSGTLQSVLFILILFTCVLLHEFGHAFAARAFGIRTRDITLYAMGGVARLNRIPDKPWQELIVAIAGPMVNVVIYAVLIIFVSHVTAGFQQIEYLESPRIELLARVAEANKFLVFFNLLPAFPMDGGRILRALLAMVLPYARATQIAAWIGQGLAVILAIVGLKYSVLLIFIAYMVFVGAQQEVAIVKANRPSPP